MLESKGLNFNPPIISLWNERRDRMCRVSCSYWPFRVNLLQQLDGRQLGYSIIFPKTLEI